MERRRPAAAERVYVDFDPSVEWETQAEADNLIVHLPDFTKQQLKVQVTATRNLRISGERQIGENQWRRFRKEIPIQSKFDANGITAKFENGVLSIRHPKLIVTAEIPQNVQPPLVVSPKPDQKPPQATPQPPKEVTKPQQSPPEPLTLAPKSTKQVDQSGVGSENQRKAYEGADRPQKSPSGLQAEGSSKDAMGGPESWKTVDSKKEASANGGICGYISCAYWPKLNKATKWVNLFLVVLSLVVLWLYALGAFNYFKKSED